MPRRVKKRRQIQTEDGVDAGWEEYYDYIFPQDQGMSLLHKSILIQDEIGNSHYYGVPFFILLVTPLLYK